MKKMFSLIKATMTEGMNIFRINTKKKNATSRVILPIFLAIVLMMAMYSYSEAVMSVLDPINAHYVLLTLFIILTSVLTVMEGVYKSGNLLFNCKDDGLLLSLPIKKGTVLFIRVFKFYVFELMYNSIFLFPSMICYVRFIHPGISYYVVSVIGLLLFPIIPILLSCIIGTITTYISSRFKKKNIMQTIFTVIFLLGIFYFSYNINGWLEKLSENATGVNDFLTKLYYPAGAYIEMITNFNAMKLLEFILIHVVAFAIVIFLISRIYFNVNSSVKSVRTKKSNKNYVIKSSGVTKAFVKKEMGRFLNSTVFVTNAGFGLVLYVIGCVMAAIKFDSILEPILQADTGISIESITSFAPVVLFGYLTFMCFMTSITSSMISLEGKSFNILKSLPIKPYKIVKAKVLTAIIAMIPFLLIGDIIIFIRFKFDIINILLITVATIILPLLVETFGILVNLKFPRMDAQNDTEVVKQGMSAMICVWSGMVFAGLTAYLLYKGISVGISNTLIVAIGTGVFTLIYLVLELILYKVCDKLFDNIVI